MTGAEWPRKYVPVVVSALFLCTFLPSDAQTIVPECRGRTATIVGTPAADTIQGTSSRDVIVGLQGDDQIIGRDGKDLICGNDGEDEIYGNGLTDRLIGGRDSDVFYGGTESDSIHGDERTMPSLEITAAIFSLGGVATTSESAAGPVTISFEAVPTSTRFSI